MNESNLIRSGSTDLAASSRNSPSIFRSSSLLPFASNCQMEHSGWVWFRHEAERFNQQIIALVSRRPRPRARTTCPLKAEPLANCLPTRFADGIKPVVVGIAGGTHPDFFRRNAIILNDEIQLWRGRRNHKTTVRIKFALIGNAPGSYTAFQIWRCLPDSRSPSAAVSKARGNAACERVGYSTLR